MHELKINCYVTPNPILFIRKIVVAGPKNSGKTIISNFLGGHAETLAIDNSKYNPTAGVRIVEFDYKSEGIEIWDSSGDHSYEGCWAAIMNDADAVLLVYNPEVAGQDQQLVDWYEYFVKRNGLRDEQCLIFAHRQTLNSESRFRPRKSINSSLRFCTCTYT